MDKKEIDRFLFDLAATEEEDDEFALNLNDDLFESFSLEDDASYSEEYEEDYEEDYDEEEYDEYDEYDEEDYEEEYEEERPRTRKRKRKILFLFLELLAITILSVSIYGSDLYFDTKRDFNANVQDQTFRRENIKVNEDANLKIADGYTDIVVFGVDARGTELESGTNSDTIIIVSINNETKKVKMLSVYRDTSVRIVDSYGVARIKKANYAYAAGGAENAISMLNTNLDLNISEYVAINFAGVADIIDALGGVELNLTEDEVANINKHLIDSRLSTGKDSPDVTQAGWQTLNGLQATTYCRLRGTTFYDEKTGEAITDDFGRTARQRLVISKLVDKAKKAGVSKCIDIAKKVINAKGDNKVFTTSFSFDQIMDMIPILLEFSLDGGEGFPSSWAPAWIDGQDCLIPKGMAYNVKKVHQFLYDEKNYTPSSTVDDISNSLINLTGIQSETEPETAGDDSGAGDNPDSGDDTSGY